MLFVIQFVSFVVGIALPAQRNFAGFMPAPLLLILVLNCPILSGQSSSDVSAAVDSFIQSADSALRSGQLEKSESDYREALGIVLKQLADGLLALHQLKQAGEAYNQASRILGLQEESWMSLAVQAFEKREYSAAGAELEKVIEVNALNFQARYLLANVEYKRGRRKQAQQYLEEVLENQNWNRSAALLLDRLNSPIENAFQSQAGGGEITAPPVLADSTREKLEKLVMEYRQRGGQLLQTLAWIVSGQGRSAEAVEMLRRASFWSDDKSLQYDLGIALWRDGRLEEAVPPLVDSARDSRFSAVSSKALIRLADDLLEAEKPDAAQMVVEFFRAHHPDSAILYLLSGRVRLLQRAVPEARLDFEKASQLEPHLRGLHYWKAVALLALQEEKAALEELEKELLENPDHAAALLEKAKIRLAMGESREAEKSLEAVLQKDPGAAEAYFHLARIQSQNGRLVQAVANLETATRLAPRRALFFAELARVYSLSGREQDAAAAMAQYRRLMRRP